jgi:alpha-galactosidase
VALSGRFGFDLDLEGLDPDELATCREAVAIARRTQPLVQQGRLQRLVSPVEGPDRSRAAMAHTDAAGVRAVLFAYQLERSDSPGPAVRPLLDPTRRYRVMTTDLGAPPSSLGERSGADLAAEGIPWPTDAPLTARIWEFEPTDI